MTPMRPSQILKNTRQNQDGQSRPDFSVSDSAGGEAPSVSVSGVSAERTAHTPGPWVASKFGFQVLTGDSWNSICILSANPEWEDGRGGYELEYEWQKREANSRLIAAAPDMLAEHRASAEDAEYLVNNIAADEPLTTKMFERIAAILERSRAAIAKAEGRS